MNILHSASLLLALLFFAGCGSFEASNKSRSRTFKYDFASQSAAQLIPATDKLDSSCTSKTDYDACLFQKNPVAQSKTTLPASPTAQTLDPLQVYGVKLTGLDQSGSLSNGTVRVETLKGALLTGQTLSQSVGQSSSQNFRLTRLKASADATQQFNQLMIYYWLNRSVEYLSVRTNYLPALDQNIRVIVDDELAGWSPRTKSIHLKRSSTNPMAWSAELAVHFFGLANLHFASQGAIDYPSSSKHRTCGLKSAGCCTQAVGCARAIASGVGDYFVGMMFPDKPNVGETWANKTEGLTHCGITRDLNAATGRKAQAVYDGCASPMKGDAIALGTIYASIWWEIRKAAAKITPDAGAIEIDTLFMNHLDELDGADDFKTAFSKIKALDNRIFQGRHISIIETEFRNRGL